MEYVPAPHARHVDADEAPTAVEYVPAPHERHVDADEAPTAVEYVPPPHARHVDKEAPTTSEYVPAKQSMHRADPVEMFQEATKPEFVSLLLVLELKTTCRYPVVDV